MRKVSFPDAMSDATSRLAASCTLHLRHEGREERVTLACARAAELGVVDGPEPRPAWLGTEEARYAATLKFAKRRREFLLGRYAAKSALREWCEQGVERLGAFDIVAGAFQQPIVHGPTGRPVTVSLAHSGELAVALAHEQGHPMGVDLERHDPARVEVVRTQVATSELPADLGPLSESAAYFLLWSAKEALSKALRCGLTCPFEVLAAKEVRIDATGLCTGTFANFGQYQFFGWMLGDYTFAVAGSRNAEFTPGLPSLRAFTQAASDCAPRSSAP